MAYIFTSESVSAGHPDKIADQISDAILDAYLAQDPNSKVACEVLITAGRCIISGEVRSSADVNHVAVARQTLLSIGYNHDSVGFDAHSAEFTDLIHLQSPEINASVVDGGAGDQGLMFGFACRETPELMPLPIALAHRIIRKLEELRTTGLLPWLRPDAKSQVGVRYNNHQPTGIDHVVISTQHIPAVSQEEIRSSLIEHVIQPIILQPFEGEKPRIIINPSGSFVLGGPFADTGLTGRKIIVDTYGGSCPHGGGAFSGKDPSKVDRSAAYAARYAAKHLVATGYFDACTIQLSYAIGVVEPTSVFVDYRGPYAMDTELLSQLVRQQFDLTPKGISDTLQLRRPIYRQTASGGHFGRPDLPWEQVNAKVVEALRTCISDSMQHRAPFTTTDHINPQKK
jgi:S-adenosylmethionine synthetase